MLTRKKGYLFFLAFLMLASQTAQSVYTPGNTSHNRESNEKENFSSDDDEGYPASLPLMADEDSDEDDGYPASLPSSEDDEDHPFTPAPFSPQLSEGDFHRARDLLKKHVRRMSSSKSLLSSSRPPLHMTPAFPDLPAPLHKHFFEKGNLTPLAIGALLEERHLLPDSFFEMKKMKGYECPILKPDMARIMPLPVAIGVNNEGIFLVQITEKGRQHLHGSADRTPVRSTTPPPSGLTSALKRMRSKTSLENPTSGPLAFVIKQTSYRTGIQELQQLTLIQDKLFERLEGKSDPHLPRIALAEHCYVYTAPDHTQHMIFVLHGAKGMPLEKCITQLNGDTTQINAMLKNIGRSIGAFHYALAPNKANPTLTLLHGDLNATNVIYNDSTGRTTLIDNGSIATAIEAESTYPDDNIFYRDLDTLIHGQLGTGALTELAPPESIVHLIDGYLLSFPESARPLILEQLKGRGSLRDFAGEID